jgi:hypothetical protein
MYSLPQDGRSQSITHHHFPLLVCNTFTKAAHGPLLTTSQYTHTLNSPLTGEGGFPCSRCFGMSLRCLPNNCATEDPVLEYVLTIHSPKVRNGCMEKKDRKDERGMERVK